MLKCCYANNIKSQNAVQDAFIVLNVSYVQYHIPKIFGKQYLWAKIILILFYGLVCICVSVKVIEW